MGEFFRPWWRKVGVVTLMMACVFMTLWIRSPTNEDIFFFTIGSPTAAVCSSFDGLLIVAIIDDADSPSYPRHPAWKSLPHHCTIEDLVSRGSMKQRYWEASGFGVCEIFSATHYVPAVFVPIWSVVIPLTLLTAYLLLFKRRKSTSMQITEPIPAEGG